MDYGTFLAKWIFLAKWPERGKRFTVVFIQPIRLYYLILPAELVSPTIVVHSVEDGFSPHACLLGV